MIRSRTFQALPILALSLAVGEVVSAQQSGRGDTGCYFGACAPGLSRDPPAEAPREPILTVPPRLPPAVLPDVRVPPPLPAGPSQWTHNDSVVTLVAEGTARRFYYLEPRSGLRDIGVRDGTLLFSGVRDGFTYRGTAYIFSRGCRPFPYEVSGIVSDDQREVTMHGMAPSPGPNCTIAGRVPDTLVFTLNGD